MQTSRQRETRSVHTFQASKYISLSMLTLYAIVAIECDAQYIYSFEHVYGVRQISFLFVIFANLLFGLFVCDRMHQNILQLFIWALWPNG
jgi:hypothetical protein